MSARILIIEDNPANMELMTYLLQAFGHTVLSVYNGEEGVETARRELPDLIICDVHLPKMDGYGVLEQLKLNSGAALRRIPVIAVTALAMVGDRQKLLAAGFDGYLGKPIEPELFVSQVEKYLDQALHSTISITEPDGAVEDGNTARPHRNDRILVIDDLLANREFICCALESSGFQVVLASSAKDGLKRLREAAFDLILCDLRMPDEDGLVLLAQVKAEPGLQQVPFVFISATIDENTIQQCLQRGAVHFLQQPIEAYILIREIDDCLRTARLSGSAP